MEPNLKQLYAGTKYLVLAYAPNDRAGHVEAYLNGLSERERKRVAALLQRSAERGPPRNKERCRKVAGEDFWEFKAYQQRIFWCYGKGRQIVLLHGFTKKTSQTPKARLTVGRRRYRQFHDEMENRHERGGLGSTI